MVWSGPGTVSNWIEEFLMNRGSCKVLLLVSVVVMVF